MLAGHLGVSGSVWVKSFVPHPSLDVFDGALQMFRHFIVLERVIQPLQVIPEFVTAPVYPLLLVFFFGADKNKNKINKIEE